MKFILYIFLLSFSIGLSAQSKWEEEKSEGNIKTYSRIKSGKKYYEFRAVFRTTGELEKAVEIVYDVANFKNWMPNTLDSKVVKKLTDSTFYAYTVTSAPKPASTRDAAFKVSKKRNSKSSFSVILEGKPEIYPIQKDKVRVKEYFAVWKITQVHPNILEVEYIASFNPGDSFPNWMIKNSLIDARIKISKLFIEQLKK